MADQVQNHQRVRLPGLDASAFQHPLDKDATGNLKKLVGFDILVSRFLELRFERLLYVFNIANSVRVGPKQFPRLYAMLRECCEILDVPEPELYVQQTPIVNAFTFGHIKPYIVLYTGLLDLLDDDETMAVIAHEVGHIKCGHVLYSTMAYLIRDIARIISEATLGIGAIVGFSIEVALMSWRMRSEYSADRAALLVMQDFAPCLSLEAKLAGGSKKLNAELDPAEFLEQAKAYDGELDKGALDRFYRIVAEATLRTHPFAVERARELALWVGSDEYRNIIAGNYPRGVRKIQIKVES